MHQISLGHGISLDLKLPSYRFYTSLWIFIICFPGRTVAISIKLNMFMFCHSFFVFLRISSTSFFYPDDCTVDILVLLSGITIVIHVMAGGFFLWPLFTYFPFFLISIHLSLFSFFSSLFLFLLLVHSFCFSIFCKNINNHTYMSVPLSLSCQWYHWEYN